MTHLPILSLLIWLPVFGGMGVLALSKHESMARWLALLTTLICIGLCIPLYANFDVSMVDWQFRETLKWIPALKIDYDLGVDGVSMPLIVLTVYTTLIVVLGAWNQVKTKVAQYLGHVF